MHHIQQSYSYEIFSKNVDHEFQNPAAIFYSFLHDFFNLYLTKDSTALLEDNTLNQCINYFFFLKTDSVTENFDILENEMRQKWPFIFQTV